ncbi:hypothetical protein K9K77_02145, partial [Candidatus Babeliales bacterium]|nr:hypothetical protein [Candidatus Babeliales bacterium]
MNKKLLILTLAMLTSGVVYGAKKDNKGKKPLTAQQLQKAQADPLKEQKRAFMRKVASDMFPGQDNKIEALTSTC